MFHRCFLSCKKAGKDEADLWPPWSRPPAAQAPSSRLYCELCAHNVGRCQLWVLQARRTGALGAQGSCVPWTPTSLPTSPSSHNVRTHLSTDPGPPTPPPRRMESCLSCLFSSTFLICTQVSSTTVFRTGCDVPGSRANAEGKASNAWPHGTQRRSVVASFLKIGNRDQN